MQIYPAKLNTKNKGVTLIEMLVVIGLSALLLPVVTKLMIIVVREIPLEQKLMMTNSDKNRLLHNIQQDIETSQEILTEFAQYKTDPNNLLIKNDDDTVILYRIEKDTVDKIILSEDSSLSIDTRPLPNAVISFDTLSQNNRIYAVQVSSHIQQKLLRRDDKKMKMRNLYFVNSMQKELYK